VVALPGYSRPLIRADQYRALVEQHTYRDDRIPREEREEPSPPTADQIEAVLPLMPRTYTLAVLVLDATGMRVGELEEKGLRCGDLDEPNTRWRVRRAVEKGRRGRWVSLPPDLFAAVLATLPPREDRTRDRPVFPGLTQERLRTAIARACKASAHPPGHRTTSATAEAASGTGKAKPGP
jgi:integrase